MNEIKASGRSLLRGPHTQMVVEPGFTVCPLSTVPHYEKGADACFSAGSCREIC